MTTLITGAAGFIGFHLASRLLREGNTVVAIDNINPYYDPNLKLARIKELDRIASLSNSSFTLLKADLHDKDAVNSAFNEFRPAKVVNLAAQAGVRYSLENPSAYIDSNITGFMNILEACRSFHVDNLLYASSSSVYGGNTNMPFSEVQSVDHPISLYAATKKSNELMAHSYSHLYGIAATGLRFFTVYGPWGRPDMALFLFTESIIKGEPIKIYNHGDMTRDFTYIDDIVESMVRLLDKPATPDLDFDTSNPNSSSSWASHRIFNIGNSQPTQLTSYIDAIEKALGKKAIREYLQMQPGDVPKTSSDNSALHHWIGFKPKTSIEMGVLKFVNWYQSFYSK